MPISILSSPSMAEPHEEVDNFKWRTPVKLVAYMQLILDVIALLAYSLGVTALFYPPSEDSPWALVAVKPFESLPEADWIALGVIIMLKMVVDHYLYAATIAGTEPRKSVLLSSLSVLFYVANIVTALMCELHEVDGDAKITEERNHALRIIIVLYYGFCLYPVKMFLNELTAACYKSVGTDPPSPEEIRRMLWVKSMAQQDTGSQLSDGSEWEDYDMYS